jgi:septal ring factor EnvC (AmiA/AmiB activator)
MLDLGKYKQEYVAMSTSLANSKSRQEQVEAELLEQEKVIDDLRERNRIGTVMSMEENNRREKEMEDSLSALEKAQRELAEEREQKKALNSDYLAVRNECELLRSKTVDDKELSALKMDRGAARQLEQVKVREIERFLLVFCCNNFERESCSGRWKRAKKSEI